MNNEIRFGSDIIEKRRQDLYEDIKERLASQAIRYIIGISGSSEADKADQTEAVLEDFIYQFSGKDCAILTGGTEGGIPQASVDIAKKFDVPTIGVFPKQGRYYTLRSSLDLMIETSPPDIGDGLFGTETPAFVNMLDGALVVGGGCGTLAETCTILKISDKRIRDKLRGVEGVKNPVYLVSLAGSGGAADLATTLIKDFGQYTELYTPESPISSGNTAARFMLEKLKSSSEQ